MYPKKKNFDFTDLTSSQVERSFQNGGASPSRTLLFIVQTLVQNRNFIDPGLYTGGVFMLSSNLYTG
ncbi:hypothetical protein TNCV_4253561 [Trichonephila clavipes]|nr:hypothetical protein TNCV_4253561 [Trichonephila clavipes]